VGSRIDVSRNNSIPNITDKNNVFRYSTDSGTTWKDITLAGGSYEISQINSEMQRLMQLNGDSGIEVTINYHALGSVVNITPDKYEVDFTAANSLAQTVEFGYIITKIQYFSK